MVDVVIPLRGVGARLAYLGSLKIARLVALVFQNQVDAAIRPDGTADCSCQFGEDVGFGIVNNGVYRVQTQPVEMIFGQPVLGILNEEIPDRAAFRAVEIDGVAPGSMVPRGEELRRI